jgi:outer membrane immunogenic protein
VRSFGTVRGRLGIAVDRWMVYGTGGFGWQNISTSETFNAPIFGTALVRGANISTTRSGLAAGGGVGVALWDKWTVGAEYLYLGAGTWNPAIANFAATGPSVVESNRGRNNIVRARLNYRVW